MRYLLILLTCVSGCTPVKTSQSSAVAFDSASGASMLEELITIDNQCTYKRTFSAKRSLDATGNPRNEPCYGLIRILFANEGNTISNPANPTIYMPDLGTIPRFSDWRLETSIAYDYMHTGLQLGQGGDDNVAHLTITYAKDAHPTTIELHYAAPNLSTIDQHLDTIHYTLSAKVEQTLCDPTEGLDARLEQASQKVAHLYQPIEKILHKRIQDECRGLPFPNPDACSGVSEK